jgi:hypothetical protein
MLVQLPYWRRLHFLSDQARLVGTFIPLLFSLILISLSMFKFEETNTSFWLPLISGCLPGNLFLMVFLMLSVISGLYWVNIILFKETEYIDPVISPSFKQVEKNLGG